MGPSDFKNKTFHNRAPGTGALFIALATFLFLLAPIATTQAKSLKPQPKTTPSLDASTFTLDNGMEVVVIPNHRAPVVAHMVWYRVGAADEKPGDSGLAHFVEHLMFKGTEDVAPDEYSRLIKALGGNHNAFTSQDYTAYYQLVAVEHLEKVMALEADRMNNLIFPPEDVKSERQVVIEERRQRTENDPRGYFFEQMQSALFTNHPYSDPVIGWLHELDALDRPHAKTFYETWYAPNNAILVVAGDITAEELIPLAEKTYGVLPAEDVPAREWTGVPPLLGLQNLTLRDPSIRQPMLNRLYRVPSFRQNKEEALALQVLEEILSGGAATRLYKNLVVDQQVATSASMSYSPASWSESTARFGLIPAPDISLTALETALDELLRDLIAHGITEKELAEAKERMIDKTVYLMDDLQSPAMVFGRALITGSTVDDVESWPRDIAAVTAEQIQAVAEKYLHPDHYGKNPYVTGYMLPPKESGRPSVPKIAPEVPAAQNQPKDSTAAGSPATAETPAPETVQ